MTAGYFQDPSDRVLTAIVPRGQKPGDVVAAAVVVRVDYQQYPMGSSSGVQLTNALGEAKKKKKRRKAVKLCPLKRVELTWGDVGLRAPSAR